MTSTTQNAKAVRACMNAYSTAKNAIERNSIMADFSQALFNNWPQMTPLERVEASEFVVNTFDARETVFSPKSPISSMAANLPSKDENSNVATSIAYAFGLLLAPKMIAPADAESVAQRSTLRKALVFLHNSNTPAEIKRNAEIVCDVLDAVKTKMRRDNRFEQLASLVCYLINSEETYLKSLINGEKFGELLHFRSEVTYDQKQTVTRKVPPQFVAVMDIYTNVELNTFKTDSKTQLPRPPSIRKQENLQENNSKEFLRKQNAEDITKEMSQRAEALVNLENPRLKTENPKEFAEKMNKYMVQFELENAASVNNKKSS